MRLKLKYLGGVADQDSNPTVAAHCTVALHPETQERTARQAPLWRVGPIPVGSERQKTRSPLPSAPIGAHTGKGRGK